MTDAEKQALISEMHEELRRWHLLSDEMRKQKPTYIARGEFLLFLLADQEGRGAVVEACPDCESFRLRPPTPNTEAWVCTDCYALFTKPHFYQRVPKRVEGQG